MPGATPRYTKVPFEWTAAMQLRDEVARDEVTWAPLAAHAAAVDVIALVLDASDDPADAASVCAVGAERAAELLLAAPPMWACHYEPSWWELVVVEGEPAGFVLPVVFDDADGTGACTGTIFHMGVVKAYRGQGLARALLRRATSTLLAHGAWRLFCDTGAGNAAMIGAFEAEGWTRLADREVPLPVLFTPGDEPPR